CWQDLPRRRQPSSYTSGYGVVSFARTSAGRLRKEAVRHPCLLPDNKRDPHSQKAHPCRISRGQPRRPTVASGVFCPPELRVLNQRESERIRPHPCGPRNRIRGKSASISPQKRSEERRVGEKCDNRWR